MDWTEITVAVSTKDIEKAGDIANMVVPYGIYIEDYSSLESEVREIANIDLIDSELLAKDRNTGLIHIYISPEESPQEAVAYLLQRFSAENIKNEIVTSNCAQEDWINNWKQYFNPIPVGNKLMIRPTWRDKYDAQGRVVLNLDPGLAFGTGSHETTRMCLCALESYAKEGVSLLDIGCGSGILSIAGLLLGCDKAVGVDIDALAVKTARENAVLNKVEDRFEAFCGNLTDKVQGKYDVVVANIVADAIIMLSESAYNFMTSKSVYIVSGIIDSRVDEVRDALSKNFSIINEITDKGWYCLVAKPLG